MATHRKRHRRIAVVAALSGIVAFAFLSTATAQDQQGPASEAIDAPDPVVVAKPADLPSPIDAGPPTPEIGVTPTADFAYGAFQRGWYLTSLALATPLAETGNAAAQTLLGVLHETGYGIEQDKDKAADWYQLAVAQGDPRAALRLAQFYLLGEGVEQDKTRAADLFEMAAQAGDANALYNLAILYQEGEGRPYNEEKAKEFLRSAAEKNDPKAQYALGIAYLEGLSGLNDPGQGAFWLGRAARRGHTSAQVYYGILRFQGRGVDPNEQEASDWFERAAVSGNPVAMNRLARVYAYGRGREQDSAKAAAWHLMARALGVSDFQLDGFVETLPEEILDEARAQAEQYSATLIPPSDDPSAVSP